MSDFSRYRMLRQDSFFKRLGKVINMVGLTIESAGPDARLGDLCRIYKAGRDGDYIHAEVDGWYRRRMRRGKRRLSPYG